MGIDKMMDTEQDIKQEYCVDVIQFMLPNGRKEYHTATLPIETKRLYEDMIAHNCRFESEVLTTGHMSITISNDEEDVDCVLTDNGQKALKYMADMLKRERWKNDTSTQ